MMGDKDYGFAGTPAASASSKATRREIKRAQDGRQALGIPEGRKKGIMMGDRDWGFPRTTGSTIRSSKAIRDRTGDFPGPQQHNPVPRRQGGRQGLGILREPLAAPSGDNQEGRQKEIMMGDKDWGFPGTPGSTIPFQGDKKGDKRRT